ncbi:MAG: glutathione peroxidase [Oscillospiraceae bacterium]|nr:glutathione peroxidase [Oscillospiraceae bacterium]
MTIYDFTVKNAEGNDVSLSTYTGKVLLIVNTATRCGLTPQYKALQELYDKYKERNFVILDFPCNQFHEQTPESDTEIGEFCSLNYGTTFPRFKKIDVNGENAEPLFTWLKQQMPKDRGNLKTKAFEIAIKPMTKSNAPADVKWNFGKFLIDRKGVVIGRYSPALAPDALAKDIERLLS